MNVFCTRATPKLLPRRFYAIIFTKPRACQNELNLKISKLDNLGSAMEYSTINQSTPKNKTEVQHLGKKVLRLESLR